MWPVAEYGRRTGYLGPDLLADDWESSGRWHPTGRDEAVRRVLSRPERSIGAALLDQRNLAGIGNEYGAEVCFLSGLHPATPVSAGDVPAVVDLAARLMQDNRHRVRRTFTGDERENTFVFGRRHRPCRRCGTRIESATLGGATSIADPQAGQERIIWWCPACQPAAG